MRVGINGMGRIGRLALRAALGAADRPEDDPRGGNRLEVVHLNELKGGAAATAHLLAFDSVQGRWRERIEAEGEAAIRIGGRRLGFSSHASPADIPWGALGVDLVLECTGKFLTPDAIQGHLDRGARRVIVAAPVKTGGVLNVVVGVNEQRYDPARDRIVTAASCTTNCLAPVAKVLNDSFGIKRGLMTTVHAATATQKTVDGPSNKDWRGGRGILENIIPSSTGAAKAVGVVIPELNKKLTGMSFRVPTSDVSVIDLTAELVNEASWEDICNAMKAAAAGPMKGVLAYTEDKVVATDFRGEPCTSVFDADAGIALDKTFVKVVAWYDNEWGYSNKVLEMVRVMASK
ncbi:MAG: type I glyceraldehyde-3-phosphate dehydrogenase [Betaproteobacteria bacterium]